MRAARPRFRGKKGSSGGGSEAPNSLRSKSLGRIIDILSEGPIRGLVNDKKGIYFNDTAWQAEDDTINFDGVIADFRYGDFDQPWVPGFPSIEREVSVGTQVEASSSVTRTISDDTLNAVRVTISLPALLRTNDDGDIKATSVNIRIDLKEFGGSFVEKVNSTITGKTNSAYERAYRIVLPATGGPFDIRVRRTTADSEDSSLINDTFWARYTEIIDHKMIYPDTAYAAVSIDAELFAEGIPSRAYLLDGIKMQIPSNYNPDTRVYTGVWDGTFVTEWSCNPAWVLYMLMTNARFGLGQWVDPAIIDKWTLYQIAQYCDGMVPNGFGGTEPRFTFNGVIRDREEAFKVMQLIASCFRGIVYWGAGSILVSNDGPKDPSVLVAPANVIDGNFDYQGVGYKARHSVALVSWNNPNDQYRTNIEPVEDADLIQKFGWKPIETVAIGCTSRGQAVRWGKWILDSEKYETETVTYKASFDHMMKDGTAVMPGDIIKLHDPSYAGIRFGGRVVSSENNATTEVTLDAPVIISIDETYSISMVFPDGSVIDTPITNGPGSTSVVVLDEELATLPLDGAMWVITGSNVAPRLFRVLNIHEVEPNIVEVTALYHDPNKFARVEQNIILEAPSFSIVTTGPLVPPTDIVMQEYLFRDAGGAVRSSAIVSWSAPLAEPRVNRYEFQIKRPNAEWEGFATTSEQSVTIPDVTNEIYSFRVRAVGALGSPSPWLTLADVTLFGDRLSPADVTNFNMTALGDQAFLVWDFPADTAVGSYTIKHQSVLTGASWGNGIQLIADVPVNTTSIFVPLLSGTYMIKSVSLAGVECELETMIVSDVSRLVQLNTVETLTAEPDWDGTFVDCEEISGALRSSEISPDVFEPESTFTFAGYIDLGEVYSNRITPSLAAFGSRSSAVMDTWTSLDAIQGLDGGVENDWSVLLEYRTTRDDPAGAPVWSDWQPLLIGDSTARAYQFRINLYSNDPGIAVFVSALTIVIDMPDRTEGEQNLSVAGGGTSVIYPNPFRNTPAVAITIRGASASDQVILTAESEGGFTVQVTNGGVGVARTVNWIARGYGRVA